MGKTIKIIVNFLLKQVQVYEAHSFGAMPVSLTPLMCVHPHKHMWPCVVLWRTQSTSYPQLFLVTVSEPCGRTGSDRFDCCVIDFNLESAACFPPLFFFIAGTLLASSRSLPPGDITDCTATENTFKQGRRARS